tara:strand:- start:6362 stop:8242 length:1881 start_codon:yes stop_codon:yes gene_type:complete
MRFKRTLFQLAMILLLLTACQNTPHLEYTIEQFMKTTSIRGSSFSPNQSEILFSSDESGIYNAYTVPVGGGEHHALTQDTLNSVLPISFFPHDRRILYRGDQGGNELWHIYLRDTDGKVTDLTPGENERALFAGWAHDEKSFFFISNKRDPRHMDVYEMDIQMFTSQLIFKNDKAFNFGGVSNNKRYMAFDKTHTRDNSDIYLYDMQSGSLKLITEHEGNISHSSAVFSVDSKSFYYFTDEDSEFRYLMEYNLETGEHQVSQKEEWGISYIYFSQTGKYRVLGINQDAQTVIKIYDTTTGEHIALPSLPAGTVTSVNISKSEKLLSFYHGGAKSTSDLYSYEIGSRKHTRLTRTMNPEVDPSHLADAEVIRYKSFDGMEIPAVYYKPPHTKKGKKIPALVWVHGGPGGQSRVGYRALIQYLANHGYAVLAVNNRGSSGYGKTFQQLDDQAHGKGDLDDCVAAKDFLISTGYVDKNKIGIIGGSYGGYMVMAALAFRPEAFEIGVNIFGVTNWVRTLKSIPPWWEASRLSLYKEIGNPETQEDYLYSISPLFHAENIVKPVIVLQGANDPRVLKVESDEMVAAVRANGVTAEYIIFDDEGHGFRKKENQIEGHEAILKFLDQHLKGS